MCALLSAFLGYQPPLTDSGNWAVISDITVTQCLSLASAVVRDGSQGKHPDFWWLWYAQSLLSSLIARVWADGGARGSQTSATSHVLGTRHKRRTQFPLHQTFDRKNQSGRGQNLQTFESRVVCSALLPAGTLVSCAFSQVALIFSARNTPVVQFVSSIVNQAVCVHLSLARRQNVYPLACRIYGILPSSLQPLIESLSIACRSKDKHCVCVSAACSTLRMCVVVGLCARAVWNVQR